MKKDRNCGATPYPIYNNYQAMPTMPIPNMMGPMPNTMMAPMYTQPISQMQSNTSDYTNLENQINMLDRRVTKLETMINSTSTYNNNFNDSNYHVM